MTPNLVNYVNEGAGTAADMPHMIIYGNLWAGSTTHTTYGNVMFIWGGARHRHSLYGLVGVARHHILFCGRGQRLHVWIGGRGQTVYCLVGVARHAICCSMGVAIHLLLGGRGQAKTIYGLVGVAKDSPYGSVGVAKQYMDRWAWLNNMWLGGRGQTQIHHMCSVGVAKESPYVVWWAWPHREYITMWAWPDYLYSSMGVVR